MNCRFCGSLLRTEMIDLVSSPPSNSFLTSLELNMPEVFYPLKLFVCEECFLVQTDEYKKSAEIFSEDYVYFSSFSTSWLAHAKKYVEDMVKRLSLNSDSFVIEIASNDGYLLQYFKQIFIPCLGIEPTSGTAKIAKSRGLDVVEDFFGVRLAKSLASEGKKADLLTANNVLAHVPNINDFVEGLKILLSTNGVITVEFPHLMNLVNENQFDTIYHEHYSYLSLTTVKRIFESRGLKIFDVEKLQTHGGSLRIFACHIENKVQITQNVVEILYEEEACGMLDVNFYINFSQRANAVRNNLVKFLIEQYENGKKVVGYGAAAKGNTLINYCGIKKDLVQFVVDRSPHKQGKFLPGSHIPVVQEDKLKEYLPDFIIIFPWNIKNEIVQQLSYVREWGCKFVIPIPKLEVI